MLSETTKNLSLLSFYNYNRCENHSFDKLLPNLHCKERAFYNKRLTPFNISVDRSTVKSTNFMSVLNINKLSGKVLVFGGVYSNLQALEQMQRIAGSRNISPENIICTGDIVGYCAQPEETVRAVMDWGIHSIAGNVEIQLREGETDCGCDFSEGGRCDVFSRNWYPFAQNALSPECIAWMKNLPEFIRFEIGNKQGLVVHGSYFGTSDFIFASTPWQEKARNFAETETNIVLAGHCGLPFHSIEDGKMWLNPGVIGMPANDGTTRVWYMLLEEKNGEVRFSHHSFTYDNKTAADLMEGNNLPREYAHTLRTGLWDNCEILPKAETELQGIKISLDLKD